MGSAHLVVCLAAYEDLIGLSGVRLGLGCVFGDGMVRHVDLLPLTEGGDVYWAGWEVD